jgi:hypothetical protein
MVNPPQAAGMWLMCGQTGVSKDRKTVILHVREVVHIVQQYVLPAVLPEEGQEDGGTLFREADIS